MAAPTAGQHVVGVAGPHAGLTRGARTKIHDSRAARREGGCRRCVLSGNTLGPVVAVTHAILSRPLRQVDGREVMVEAAIGVHRAHLGPRETAIERLRELDVIFAVDREGVMDQRAAACSGGKFIEVIFLREICRSDKGVAAR